MKPVSKSVTKPAGVHYSIGAKDVNAHLWRITLKIAKPAKDQQVSLPVWIPGSYMVREFSKHLQNLQAEQHGKAVLISQLDKCSWQIECASRQPLVLSYEVYAFDNSVRSSWLSAERAFFNPTSLCLRVHGQESKPHEVTLDAIKDIASCAAFFPAKALNVSKNGFGDYFFANYDELTDMPCEINAGWQGRFTVRGVEHVFVVSGALPSFDGARLLADTKKIVETEMAFWHGDAAQATNIPPFDRYIFMLNAVDDGYGGLEHRNSTALICSRRDLPRVGQLKQSDGYTTLLGLISHEYFHTWNVKRLKPQEFVQFNYAQENYSRMLWFFEGFTSYYDDLLLRRAGLIDNTQYLRLLAKTMNQVQQTPGRLLQSVAQASMDAWVKYYRQDENTPNATVSYYTKGSLVALCFDLALRQEKSSLDALMRALWKSSKAAQPGKGGITETDVADALLQLTGRSWSQEIQDWVHGTQDLPLQALLAKSGVTLSAEPAAILPIAQRLGLRVSEAAGTVVVKTVLRGGLAEQAGICAGDEWLAVDDWRLQKLEDLPQLAGRKKAVNIMLSRDKRIVRSKLQLPAEASEAVHSFTLRPQTGSAPQEAMNAWLAG